MEQIYIGKFNGFSEGYGEYNAYLNFDSIYRSGNNIVLNNAHLYLARIGNGYTTNRLACKIGNGGNTNNIMDNYTINNYGSASAAAYDINLGTYPIATNGDYLFYVALKGTGGSNSWDATSGDPLVWDVALANITPTAPSAPASASIPSAIAPDKTANVSWNAASGGSNGVSGYILYWSKDGGSSWNEIDVGNVTNYNLNLNSLGFVQGSILKIAVRSYTTVNSQKFYSGWTFSGQTTTLFVAPSVPKNVTLSVVSGEPILTATYRTTWSNPDTGGTNGISGYLLSCYKNNTWIKNIDVGNVLSKDLLLSDITTYDIGDTLKIGVYAYTIGQSNRYYSDMINSGVITIISDKFIQASINGGAFTKYKMYISINGASFIEVKKEKFITIQ